jgi:4'-phosphopantetheinyl transferase
MIYIYFVNIDRKLEDNVYRQLLQQLPAVCQTRINRLQRWQDAQRSLLGLHLLEESLAAIGEDPSLIKTIVYQDNGKPCLASSVNFTISHSGSISLCAISTDALVGIDIEEIVSQPLLDFETQFTGQEWSLITNSQNSIKQFYTCWTKKESLVKATGKGLSTDLSLINTVSEQINWDGEQWHWIQLPIHVNYMTHLACNTNSPHLHLKEYQL